MAGFVKNLLLNSKSVNFARNLKNSNLRVSISQVHVHIFNHFKRRLLHRKHKYAFSSISSFHTSNVVQKKRKTSEEKKLPKMIQYAPKSKGEMVDVWRNITVAELAGVLNRDIHYVYDLFLGKIKGRNTPITDIKELHNGIRRGGKRMKIIAKPEEEESLEDVKDIFRRPPPTKLECKQRPPIVTIMGHVDHGKTTLLDALRHSSVVEEEFGGITQHIGAFSVKLESGATITFLDTPGHAAFSAMRARGTQVTDVVVLVVAADDGVMEQTVECIKMANRAKVPMLVAINKIDAPKANIERTQQMLLQKGIQVEQLGGDVQAVCISALKKTNLNQLTEALVLQAEIMEIGADPSGPVEAVVIESRLDPQRGCLCTLVIQRGTLKKGDILVADTAMAKVRLLRNAQGQILDDVPPGFPAEVEGWRDLPPAGELILQVQTERQARSVIKFREEKKVMKKVEEDAPAIAAKEEEHMKEYKEKLQLRRRLGRFKMRNQGPRKPEIVDDDTIALKLVIKADVDGTLEAILEALSTYQSQECEMQIISFGVGPITDNDVELAKTFKGIVYAFNVECPGSTQQKAEADNIPVKHFNVIYNLIDTIKEDINSKLPLKRVEEVVGEATVLQQFLINDGRKKISVAGCMCTKGNLKKKSMYKVKRNDEIIYEGSLASMRHLKNEVDTIKVNSECGLQMSNKSILFEPNDLVICYEIKMEPQTINWNPGF